MSSARPILLGPNRDSVSREFVFVSPKMRHEPSAATQALALTSNAGTVSMRFLLTQTTRAS